jgi:hypothetical protein
VTQKAAVYAAMPRAHAEASDGGQLPAPARQVGYALRRITGLGNALSMDYLLKGNRGGLINAYLEDHPEETADWDIVRDARGTLGEPHTGRRVPLGTIEVRDYLRWSDDDPFGDDDDYTPEFALRWQTYGPRDRYSAILYIEKEGFSEQLAADRLAERWDLAICSSKGYSVKAARTALVTLARRNGVRPLVAHDFDVQGTGIYDLINREVEAVDLGLRLADVEDARWGLASQAEPVTHRSDPLGNLQLRGATPDEIAFLRHADDPKQGRRVELNALVGRQFIDWLEAALDRVGVEKVIPDQARLAQAYRRGYKRHLLNRAIRDAGREASQRAADLALPDDLVARVTAALAANRTLAWDLAVADLVAEIDDANERDS